MTDALLILILAVLFLTLMVLCDVAAYLRRANEYIDFIEKRDKKERK